MLTDKEFLSFINDKSLDGSLKENLNKIIDEEMEKSEEEMDTELIEYTVTHELGHCLGLYESSQQGNIMTQGGLAYGTSISLDDVATYKLT